jgi:predicted glycogen debranching enzyme
MATSEKQPVRTALEQKSKPPAASTVIFGREICNDLAVAEQREWLVTNGIGGFASGTVSGNLTRRYHGLLIAALNPPVGRTQLVAKVEEIVSYDDSTYELATNRWTSGAIAPQGYVHLQSFRLEGTVPVWRFSFGDVLLEKRVWMQYEHNTTYVHYNLIRGTQNLGLRIKSLLNNRDYHSSTHAGDWQMKVEAVPNGIQVVAFDGAVPINLLSADGTWEPHHEWHRDCFLPQEKYRGLDDHEDHLHAASFTAMLSKGKGITLVFTTEREVSLDGALSLKQQKEHQSEALNACIAHNGKMTAASPD